MLVISSSILPTIHRIVFRLFPNPDSTRSSSSRHSQLKLRLTSILNERGILRLAGFALYFFVATQAPLKDPRLEQWLFLNTRVSVLFEPHPLISCAFVFHSKVQYPKAGRWIVL